MRMRVAVAAVVVAGWVGACGDDATPSAAPAGPGVDATGACAEMREAYADLASGLDPVTLRDGYQDLAAKTVGREDVSSAFEQLGEELAQVLAEVDAAQPGAAEQLGAALAALSSQELVAASQTVQDWFRDGCEGL